MGYLSPAECWAAEIETSTVSLRDYDCENPKLDPLEGKEQPFDASYFPNEARLEDYAYRVGRFKSSHEVNAGLRLLDEHGRSSLDQSPEDLGDPQGTVRQEPDVYPVERHRGR